MKTDYILPRTKTFRNKSEFINSYDPDNRRPTSTKELNINAILNRKESEIVMGDPGMGKSRLLINLFENCEKNAVFISLKNVGPDESIEEYIQNPILDLNPPQKLEIGVPIYSNIDGLEDPEIIFLDGLDEVRDVDYYLVAQKIAHFHSTHKEIKMVISGRTHIFFRHQADPLLLLPLVKFHQLAPFDSKEAVKFLGLDETDFEIIKPFIRRYDTFKTPRYLNFVLELKENHSIREIGTWSRHKLFSEVINLRLKGLERKGHIRSSHIFHLKKALRELAFFMELRQLNTIQGDDFAEFEVECLQGVVANQNLLADLLENSILRRRDDFIEFDNTEFQEFLAATQLVRLGPVREITNRVAIDLESQSILSNWIEPLGFVIEQKPELFTDLVLFLCQSETFQDQSVFSKLKQYLNFEQLPLNSKEKIAINLFEHASKNKVWIRYDIVEIVAQCFTSAVNEYLREQFVVDNNQNREQFFRNGNVAIILEKVAKWHHPYTHNLTSWRNDMEELALAPKLIDNDLPQRVAIDSLCCLGTKNSIAKLTGLYGMNNNLNGSIRFLCREIDPNSFDSIDKFCDSASEHRMISGIYIDFITDQESHLYFLDKLLENNQRPYLWEKLEVSIKFAKNLAATWTLEVENKLKMVIEHILSVDYAGFSNQLPQVLLKAWQMRTPNLLSHLIHGLSEEVFIKFKMEIRDFLTTLIPDENLLKLREAWLQREKNLNWLVYPLQSIMQGKEKREMFQVFPEIEVGRKEAKSKKVNEEGKKYRAAELIYNEFKKSLQEKDWSVIYRFIAEEDQLSDFFSPVDKHQVLKLAKECLNRFSIDEFFINIESRNGSTVNSISSVRPWLIGAALFVVIDHSSGYREYTDIAFCFLPLLINYEHLKRLKEMLPPPDAQTIDIFVDFWNPRHNDDRLEYRFFDILRLVKDFEIIQFLPIIKSLTGMEYCQSEFHQRSIADLLKEVDSDEDFCLQQFRRINVFSIKAIWANLLLHKYGSVSALEWIIKQSLALIQPAKREPFPKSVTTRGITDLDRLELDDFAKLQDVRLLPLILFFLERSFELIKGAPEYYETISGDFLPGIISYLENLIRNGEEQIVARVESKYSPFRSKYPLSFFEYKVAALRTLENRIKFQRKPIFSVIREVRNLKFTKENPFDSSSGFFRFLCDCIDTDLAVWLQESNKAQVFKTEKVSEKLLQEMIQNKLKAILLEKGIQGSIVIREAANLSGNKIDFWVGNGVHGRVLIELKLSHNNDLLKKKFTEKYNKKLKNYRMGLGVPNLILLIAKVDLEQTSRVYSNRINTATEFFQDNEFVEVIGIDCFEGKA